MALRITLPQYFCNCRGTHQSRVAGCEKEQMVLCERDYQRVIQTNRMAMEGTSLVLAITLGEDFGFVSALINLNADVTDIIC